MKWKKPAAVGAVPAEVERPMKLHRASILTKVVVLVLLIATATALLNLRSQIQTAQADLEQARAQVDAQIQVNADLADAVANSDDPERQADIARSKLGLVEQGEQVFYFTN
jgi:cell division protein DivIC